MTPIQMAVAYAAIANGGVILEPRVVRERVSRDGEVIVTGDPVVRDHLPVAPEYLEVLRDALEAVVAEPRGTGTAARIPGVRVAGKTGTAQVVRLKHTEDLEEGEIPVRHRDHAWFVGFAPVDAPEIVVVALVEHGGHGGSAAAPIAGKVMQRYFEKQRRDLEPALAAAEDTDAGG
ncbi:MAG: penicillin-binding transpeptidase domain-containing protein [Myxococcota bacterium]|nr:penicillin-binding transpeptidase domain-containing protein [Myxococcota bacterium]